MVRLGGVTKPLSKSKSRGFNSNMVRLGALMARKWIAAALFQFQYGAIRGTLAILVASSRNMFQFQYGAIRGPG